MAELLESISSEELTEWAAMQQLDPLGSSRGDLQAAIVAATIANVFAAKGRHFTPSQFMPKFDQAGSRSMSEQDILKTFKMIAGRA